MNDPHPIGMNTLAGEQIIKSGTLIALVGIVLLYSWKTGNTLRIASEYFSLDIQSSNGK